MQKVVILNTCCDVACLTVQLPHIKTGSLRATDDNHTFTHTHARTHARTHPFNGPFSGTTRVSRYQKGKTNLDFTEARDSEWQWHQLAICKSAPCSRQITTPAPHRSVFLQAGCPSCRPTNSVKALKGNVSYFQSDEKVLHFSSSVVIFSGGVSKCLFFSEIT